MKKYLSDMKNQTNSSVFFTSNNLWFHGQCNENGCKYYMAYGYCFYSCTMFTCTLIFMGLYRMVLMRDLTEPRAVNTSLFLFCPFQDIHNVLLKNNTSPIIFFYNFITHRPAFLISPCLQY